MIEVKDLVVDRGKLRVLDGFTCSVPTGSITGLLGPSGSGKTTLMRAIVGVQIVRSGTITVLGRPAGSSALRHKIGYLTQAPSVYADLTVRENARYFASLYGIDSAYADQVVADVGLAGAATQLVGDLSGGQHSRASLACALVGKPEVLVLDEPTVGQDPVLRDELWSRFRQLAADGATVLVSSHVMDEANRCDRLLLIRRGELIADDTPAAVKTSAGTEDLDQAFLTLIRRHGELAGNGTLAEQGGRPISGRGGSSEGDVR
jgi:ABC-2 type transport system ATP-binding protein